MWKSIRSTGTALVLCAFSTAASSQAPAIDVTLLDLDELAGNGATDATILDANYDERALTVRFESDDETARVIVPEAAEIVQMAPNNIERPVDLTQLNPGDEVTLTAVEVDDALHLRIVGSAS